MSLLEKNTSSDAEASTESANGFKSSPSIDFTFLDWDVVSSMAHELQIKCDEYGGAYPRENWKLGGTNSHLNSLVQHVAAFHTGIGDEEEHLLHVCIRAMFALSTYRSKQASPD